MARCLTAHLTPLLRACFLFDTSASEGGSASGGLSGCRTPALRGLTKGVETERVIDVRKRRVRH